MNPDIDNDIFETSGVYRSQGYPRQAFPVFVYTNALLAAPLSTRISPESSVMDYKICALKVAKNDICYVAMTEQSP